MKAKDKHALGNLLLIAVVGGLVYGMFFMDDGGTATTFQGTETCLGLASPPDVLPGGVSEPEPGTAISETGVYRLQGKKAWTVFTSNTAVDDIGAPGEKVDFLFGVTTATAEQIDNAYGPFIQGYTIQCQEDDNTGVEALMTNDEVEGSVTATFYNRVGNNAAQAFSAGQSFEVSCEFIAGNLEVFGNPYIKDSGINVAGRDGDYPNVFMIPLNKSRWDKPEKVYVRGGKELERIACPSVVTASTTNDNYCYGAPVVGDSTVEIVMDLKADDTNAPVADQTAELWAGGFFIDDDGEVSWGSEDDDQVFVAANAAVDCTLDFT